MSKKISFLLVVVLLFVCVIPTYGDWEKAYNNATPKQQKAMDDMAEGLIGLGIDAGFSLLEWAISDSEEVKTEKNVLNKLELGETSYYLDYKGSGPSIVFSLVIADGPCCLTVKAYGQEFDVSDSFNFNSKGNYSCPMQLGKELKKLPANIKLEIIGYETKKSRKYNLSVKEPKDAGFFYKLFH